MIEPVGSDAIEAAVQKRWASRSKPPASRWRHAAQPFMVAIVLPAVTYLVLRPEPFYRLTIADPFIYAGYTVAPADLIARLGYPYYAVRFGYIVPANLLTEMFGVLGGYFALRWLLTAVAVAAVFICLRVRYRASVALVGCVLLVANPIFARSVLTSYVSAIVLPATAVSCALLATQEKTARRGILLRAGAGVAIGVAFAANPFSAFPNLLAVLAAGVSRGRNRWKATLAELAALSAGASAVVVVGALIYWVRFGDPDVIGPSLDAARRYSANAVPGTEIDLHWLQFRPETWLALLAAAALALALVAARQRPVWQERVFLAMPITMWLGFAVHQFVLGGNTLETYFYNSQLLPASSLAIAAALGVLATAGDVGGAFEPTAGSQAEARAPVDGRLPFVGLGGVALALGALTVFSVDIWTIPGVLTLLALLTVGAAAVRRTAGRVLFAVVAAALPVVLALGAPQGVPLSDGQPFRQDALYREAFFNPDMTWLRRYELAADLVRHVPRTEIDPGSVVFWYSDDDQLATLMQWTYLWVYTKLQQSGDPPMPELSPQMRRALLDRTPRFLMVLSSDPAEVDQAVGVLKRLGVEAEVVRSDTLQRASDSLSFALLTLDADACDLDGEGTPTFWITRPTCPTP